MSLKQAISLYLPILGWLSESSPRKDMLAGGGWSPQEVIPDGPDTRSSLSYKGP
jgi:hypothetical protein